MNEINKNEVAENIDIDSEKLKTELKSKYGKIYEITIENEEIDRTFVFYFKNPTAMSYNRLIKNISKRALSSMTDFTLDNIVPEVSEQYKDVLKEYPAVAMSFGEKLMSLLGISSDVTVKKL